MVNKKKQQEEAIQREREASLREKELKELFYNLKVSVIGSGFKDICGLLYNGPLRRICEESLGVELSRSPYLKDGFFVVEDEKTSDGVQTYHLIPRAMTGLFRLYSLLEGSNPKHLQIYRFSEIEPDGLEVRVNQGNLIMPLPRDGICDRKIIVPTNFDPPQPFLDCLHDGESNCFPYEYTFSNVWRPKYECDRTQWHKTFGQNSLEYEAFNKIVLEARELRRKISKAMNK